MPHNEDVFFFFHLCSDVFYRWIGIPSCESVLPIVYLNGSDIGVAFTCAGVKSKWDMYTIFLPFLCVPSFTYE